MPHDSPLVALLLDGPRKVRPAPFKQFESIRDELAQRQIPIETYAVPERPSLGTLLGEGRFAAMAVGHFARWYRSQVNKYGEGRRFVIGAYSVGGLAFYSWCADPAWREEGRLAYVFALAAPHQCVSGRIFLEREDGGVYRYMLPVTEPHVDVGTVARRLGAKLDVFYGVDDRTTEPGDAQFPDDLTERYGVRQFAVSARHLTIGANEDVNRRITERIAALAPGDTRIGQTPVLGGVAPANLPLVFDA